jgi:hypothetical protein
MTPSLRNILLLAVALLGAVGCGRPSDSQRREIHVYGLRGNDELHVGFNISESPQPESEVPR